MDYSLKVLFWALPGVMFFIIWGLIEIVRKARSWVFDKKYENLGVNDKIDSFFGCDNYGQSGLPLIIIILGYTAFAFIAAAFWKIVIPPILVLVLIAVGLYSLRSFIRFRTRVNKALDNKK